MSKWRKCLECERPAVCKGRCKVHYDKQRKLMKVYTASGVFLGDAEVELPKLATIIMP